MRQTGSVRIHTIRQRKEKEKTSTKAGTKTVIVLDYRKEEP